MFVAIELALYGHYCFGYSSVENYQEHANAIAKITKDIYELSLCSQSKQSELTACKTDIIAAGKELEAAYKKLEMDIKRRSVSAISGKVLLLLEDLQNIIFDRLIQEVRVDNKEKTVPRSPFLKYLS